MAEQVKKLAFMDRSLYSEEIFAATSTGAGDARMKSSVGALLDFLPQAIRLKMN